MINKELQTLINSDNMLELLAKNLNITEINANTNIKKIADSFKAEMRTYATVTNNAIGNCFISTMSDAVLEAYAAEHGLYRKKYSVVKISGSDQAIQLELQSDMIFDIEATNFIPFRVNDVLYQDEVYTIVSKNDIKFSTTSAVMYPDVEITLNSQEDAYVIPEGASFQIKPTQVTTNGITPFYTLRVNYPIGLAMLEETVEDFRLRVYESTYTAQNIATSLLSSVVKDVPLIERLTTNPIEDGRSIDVIYPFTRELLDSGSDPLIQSLIIPMIETSLATKMYYQNMILVKEPEPIFIQISLNISENQPTVTLLEYIATRLNQDYSYKDSCTVSDVVSLVSSLLTAYSVEESDIKVTFLNPNLSEYRVELDSDFSIPINAGKFIFFYPLEVV